MAGEEKVKKEKAEVTVVKMSDGREVGFAGKRRMVKETIIDESKVVVDGNTVTLEEGAVAIRLDFRTGDTRTWTVPVKLIPRTVGHGGEQKLGDETAGDDKIEDMILHVDDLISRLNEGEWRIEREAGGFSGASVVIRALMEASGQAAEKVKAFLQGKLDAATAKGEKLSRQDLYNSFRNPNSEVGKIIEKLEREERSKNVKVDADAELAALKAT